MTAIPGTVRSKPTPNTSTISHTPAVMEPVSDDALLPHRKVMRPWLIPLSQRSTRWAMALLGLDYALLLMLLAGVVQIESVWLKLPCGLAVGFMIGRLFVVGHDGCHNSLSPHRNLNKWLGRIAFFPSLTAHSLQPVGCRTQHGAPRLHPSQGWGLCLGTADTGRIQYPDPGQPTHAADIPQRMGPRLYYMVAIWWKKMMFPRQASTHAKRRRVFMLDCLLVSAFALLRAGALVTAAMVTDQSIVLLLLLGFVTPLLFWFNMMGFVIYGHHTHVKVSWHNDRATWQRAQPFVSTTVHLTFPVRIGGMLHHIMEHTAHHVDMGIPLYRLKAAQQKLEELLPGRIVIQPFFWRRYFATARACKRYDFSRNCWTNFAGHPTSPARENVPAAREDGLVDSRQDITST
jgi:omega-6 fatty acid desaturase (delta-12 desaturase)